MVELEDELEIMIKEPYIEYYAVVSGVDGRWYGIGGSAFSMVPYE